MTREDLLEIITTISRHELGKIGDDTPLSALFPGSLSRARLDAALRSRWSISEPRIYQVKMFGELCALLGLGSTSNGEPPNPAAYPVSSDPKVAQDGIRLGVDIEAIADLPMTKDYWEESFYKETFSPKEIAYAQLQPSPPATFAAMWCAKEAVRKANVAFATTEWKAIEVLHDNSGRPTLHVNGEPIGGALSLSHASDYAIATYCACSQPTPEQEQVAPITPATITPEATRDVSNRSNRFMAVVTAFSLLLSVLAFLYAVSSRR